MSIRSSVRNQVAIIEIARPEKKNALTAAMYEALAVAVRTADQDPMVRALLLTGQPGVFTAGNDLHDFLERPPTSEDAPAYRFMRALIGCEKPVVAAVSGAAVGIGTTLLLHCDLVYVSPEARFSLPFVALGLVPEFASSVLLTALAGRARAAEKLLLAEPFSGAEALELGLATALVPAAEVLEHALHQAERFNALPPGAVRDTKRLMRAALAEPIERALAAEGECFYERLRSPEAREAFRAFLEKRKPDFSKL